jgi:hypothetical protein
VCGQMYSHLLGTGGHGGRCIYCRLCFRGRSRQVAVTMRRSVQPPVGHRWVRFSVLCCCGLTSLCFGGRLRPAAIDLAEDSNACAAKRAAACWAQVGAGCVALLWFVRLRAG